MKRLMVMVLLMYAASCSNPEDKVAGSDSASEVTNSRPGPTDPNSQSDVAKPDSSSSPSTSKENANSSTQGTNRSYGDTAKKKQ